MNLSYYNEEVDKILWDILGNDSFTESDLSELINMVSSTIYQYHKNLSKSKLKLVVQYLIDRKYQKVYLYDNSSEFNQVVDKLPTDKNNKSSSLTENDLMSINESDIKEADKLDFSTYINPELETESVEKVQFSSCTDLISHRHDYPHDTYKESIYIKRRKRVVEIKKIPQHEQKSIEWLNQRNECLTATAVAVVLDEDPYKYPIELLMDKCDRGVPFVENENVHHGKKYEQIGTMFYAYRNNIVVGEYGLIQHDKHTFIGASPDGICDKNALDNTKMSKLVGRLLEIKFPKTRKINTEGKLDGDICPRYYFLQIQTQLFVTELDECDFLQCKIEEYDSWEDFIQDSNAKIPGLSKKTNLEKGCLIQLLPKAMIGVGDPNMCLYNAQYIYPPKLHMTHDEIEKWIAHEILHYDKNEFSKKYMIDKIIYWRLSQVACHLIKADPIMFESKIPTLKQFWDYVLFYRKHTKKLDNLIKLVAELGNKKSAEIFERVHKDYLSIHPNTKYQPLYQSETEWRKKYNIKYANYQKNKSFWLNKKKKTIVNV